MLNRDLRYIPILPFLPRRQTLRVLEVGSGTEGIARYVEQKIFGVDLDFKDYAGLVAQAPRLLSNLAGVMADARRLPFRAKAFDMVICMDMLEHVRPEFRIEVLHELMRVTGKTLVIGFPCGEDSLQVEKKIEKTLAKRQVPAPPWLAEHLANGLPSSQMVEQVLGHDCHIDRFPNENRFVHYAVVLLESLRGWYSLTLLASKTLRFGLRWAPAAKCLAIMVNGLFSKGRAYRKIYLIQRKS